jgi:hypothetical protein
MIPVLILALALAAAPAAAQTPDTLSRTTAAPPTATDDEALVAAVIDRWEAANGVSVTTSVRAPLMRETARQLARAPADIDRAAAVDDAVGRYLNDDADYRKSLRQALETAASPPPPAPPPPMAPPPAPPPPAAAGGYIPPPVIAPAPSPYPPAPAPASPPPSFPAPSPMNGSSGRPSFLGQIFHGFGEITGGWLNPVPPSWDMRLLADKTSPKVSIDGESLTRNTADIYRVSGGRVRIELFTTAGHCQRQVRPVKAEADCR